MVSLVYNFPHRVWCLRNIACLVVACVVTACGSNSPTKKLYDAISQQQAEDLRDTCVADSLALLQELGDRIAPLARAKDVEQLEAAALARGCSFETTAEGYRLLCPAMDLRGSILAVELILNFVGEETALQVNGSDAMRSVHGNLIVRDDPERGLVLQGVLEAINDTECRAVAEFNEVIGLEAFDLPGDLSSLHFREGAVQLTLYSDTSLRLARGSAALSGRNAFVVLNFDEFSLSSEMSFR
jgi:hypothetical protein